MANAKKRDRCGRYYDPPTNIKLVIGHRNHQGIFRTIDLCEECQVSLDTFMSFGGLVDYEEQSDEQVS